MQSRQLTLGIGMRPGRRFANFVPGPNAEALERTRAAAMSGSRAVLFLWGGPGAGKTHLLEAACAVAAGRDATTAYVPLGGEPGLAPRVLDGLERAALVCLDDLDAVAGRAEWEEALFHLFNRAEAAGATFLAAGARAPGACGFALADLASRLASGLVLRLAPLGDEDRIAALRAAATQRGLDLPREVAAFVLARSPRDMHSLVDLLDRMDRESLERQRRLTIPLVRDLLDG